MRTAIVISVLLLLGAGSASQLATARAVWKLTRSNSEFPQRQTEADKSAAAGTPCLFEFERGEVPNCVLKKSTEALFIAQQYLKDLKFDSLGLAAVRSPIHGWMYVNRKGTVLISGVAVMDNWADEFHDGLVRFVKDNKYGFANRAGRIVIPPIYDGAMNFEKGNAEVCKGCRSKCVEIDCEYHVFSGGDWFLINTKGVVLKQIPAKN